MREIEFAVSRNCDFDSAEGIIERIWSKEGLRLTMKGTLSRHPGSVHWHYKEGDHKGTLELTRDVSERRIWAKVQDVGMRRGSISCCHRLEERSKGSFVSN